MPKQGEEKNVFHVSQIKPTANTCNAKKENTYNYSYTKFKTYKHFDVFLINENDRMVIHTL